LIIDEINRGNIAKIFGELITLLEKDKRDSLKCTLPYSRKPFVLPSNLYVIGTMNTADRSIAVIDTALRRRFSFKEIEPEPSLIINPQLSDINNTVSLDLEELLKAINKKIASVLDRDHRIGHSYFMDIDSIKDLRNVWYLQIVPLLMEYFYNDFKSIQSIIGSNLIDTDGKVKDFQNDDTQFLNALQAIYNH
jgi:5-methylcytosine-specific restriction protein B